MLIPPHPLTNFDIQVYYQNKPRFNGVYSRDNLPDKIKDGAYVINLDEYSDVGTHWIALYVRNKTGMLTCKSFIDFTNLFSPNNFKKNDDIILNYFLNKI